MQRKEVRGGACHGSCVGEDWCHLIGIYGHPVLNQHMIIYIYCFVFFIHIIFRCKLNFEVLGKHIRRFYA